MNINSWYRILLVAVFLATAEQASAAPTLLVNGNGILTGAHNVAISGKLYDVTFGDTVCNQQSPGCTILFFPDDDAVGAAAQALLDQVFIDGPAGNFNSVTNKIFGCGSTALCQTFIPYFTDSAASVINRPAGDDIGDYYFLGGNTVGQDFTLYLAQNYAFFTSLEAAINVPEPGGLELVAAGFAALALKRRFMVSAQQRLR